MTAQSQPTALNAATRALLRLVLRRTRAIWLRRSRWAQPILEEAESQFNVLADRWTAASKDIPELLHRYEHPAYRQIIGLGFLAVPPILKQLEAAPGWWLFALTEIAGEDPASEADSLEAAAQIWLEWGRAHGFHQATPRSVG